MNSYRVSIELSFDAEDEDHAIEQFVDACGIDTMTDPTFGGYVVIREVTP